jgi:predicted MFS family arabinose efflux permease
MQKIKSLTKAYAGISKEMWLLAAAMLINRSGSMVLLFMSVYLTKEKHFSIPQAGVVLSLFGIGSLVGAFIGGKLVDRIGFYPILIWSLILSGIMILLLGQMKSFYLIAFFTFLVTAFGDMFRPANSASISSYSTQEGYTQAIALNRLAMNLGFTIGPMLGGLLASHSYTLLFWADGLTCMFAAGFIFFMLPKKQFTKPTTPTAEEAKAASPYRDSAYLYFLIFTTLYAIAFFQLITALPLYYKNVYFLNEKHIGWLMALNGIGVAVIEMFLIYYIRNKWTEFKFISLGIILLMLSYLILVPFHSILILIVSVILITFSEMLAMPFMSTHSMKRASPKAMGEYMALYSMCWSVALILAPLLGSQIIALVGYNGLWISVAGIGFISLVGFRFLESKH